MDATTPLVALKFNNTLIKKLKNFRGLNFLVLR